MRVYILTDLEGVAGVDQPDPRAYPIPDGPAVLEEMLSLLVGEVNAAIEGAVAAFISSIRTWRHGLKMAGTSPARFRRRSVMARSRSGRRGADSVSRGKPLESSAYRSFLG